MKRPLLLLAALGGLITTVPGSAPALDRPDLVLVLEASKAQAGLGEEIVFSATLERRRGRPVEVHALRLARNSVSLRVEQAGRTQAVTRIHGEIAEVAGEGLRVVDSPAPRTMLVRGSPLRLEVPLLAVLPGRQTWRAVYAGLPDGAEPLLSAPVEVEVSAAAPGARVRAALDTTEGTILLDLWPERALNTVLHFLDLARRDFYTGLTFHRIAPGFLVQGGDPKGDGTGGAGYFLPDETFPEAKHERGVLSLARAPAVPDSGGCQFFLLLVTDERLDGRYTAFGRVAEGMEALDRLAALPVEPAPDGEVSRPVEPPIIRSLRMVVR